MMLEDAVKKLGSISKLYSADRYKDFWEFVVDKFGDTLTYRVYDSGLVTER